MRLNFDYQILRRISCVGILVMPIAFFASTPALASGDSLCGPFDQVAQLDLDSKREILEPGVTTPGSIRSGARSNGHTDVVGLGAGTIVRLAAPSPSPSTSAAATATPALESEALLALPKNSAGAIPTNFELGVGARISSSFFSPVICATLARVTGPPGTSLDQLVTVIPDGSIVVPNDIYASAASEVRAAPAPSPSPSARASSTRIATQASRVSQPDPYVSLQYGLAISGVRSARELSSGAGVKIALLDSAPEIGHRDLSGTRIRPLANQPGSSATATVGVHGTLMAGVIAAVEGNGFGIMGLAPDAELISIPICKPAGTAGGTCTIFDLLQGLDRAWESEVQLVNLSLAGPPNPLLERGVARLEELGVVVVAAAGNEGTTQRRYPAAYPSVIGVGAVDSHGLRFAASNRGDWVEIDAPGVEVLSTVPGDAFAFGSGTSLAAAHVTGSLAVLTAAVGDPKIARAELFRTMHSDLAGGGRSLPDACEVFARLGLRCDIGAGD